VLLSTVMYYILGKTRQNLCFLVFLGGGLCSKAQTLALRLVIFIGKKDKGLAMR
jgi:hypothetical protein